MKKTNPTVLNPDTLFNAILRKYYPGIQLDLVFFGGESKWKGFLLKCLKFHGKTVVITLLVQTAVMGGGVCFTSCYFFYI